MSKLGEVASWIGLLAALALAGPAWAQDVPTNQQLIEQQQQRRVEQPGNNAPVWREVRSGRSGSTLVPGNEMGVLILSSGQTWRAARVPLAFWGGLLIAAAIAALALFYLIRGMITVKEPPGGRLIRRFSAADRYAHWLLAMTWVVLAVTGLVISFGRDLLLPVIGYTLFSWLAILSKNVHNFAGPILIVAVPWMFVKYVRDNGIGVEDLKWFVHIFGYFRGREYPSARFNAGEKLVFWLLLVVFTTILVVTGLILNFSNFGQTRSTMQTANLIHMTTAYLAMAIAAVHIYLGTIGMAGAYRAMKEGYVTEAWAEHHHKRWYDDVKAGKSRQKFAASGEGTASASGATRTQTS
ncbi:MAG: formate dehydrogenase subunit gamma [Burkholderiales bacterium]|nr:formate dehydrogenase subunit gamma [Burkholderiales bacterium]